MSTHNTWFGSLRTAARMTALAAFLVGPLAGFAAAQDDGINKMGGAGFVLYVSIMRAR